MPNPLEDPTPVIVIGVILEVILGTLLWQSRRGVYLKWMGMVVLGVLLGVAIEWLVVTQRERVLMTIYESRDAVRENNLARLDACIAPSAPELRQWASAVLGRVRFTKVNVTDVQVTVDSHAVPYTARARLSGTALFDDRQGEFPRGGYTSRFTVDFVKLGERYLINNVVDEQNGQLPRPHTLK